MKSGIYKITNTVNNKVYVGQAVNLGTRYGRHLYRIKRNEHHNDYIQRAFDKYGENSFKYEILEEIKDLSLLDSREKFWIDHHGGINSDDTYNLKDPLLNEYNDYVKKKMSKSSLGKNNPNYGNKWTDEQKEKASKNKKGVTLEDRIGKDKAKLVKQKMSKSQAGRKHSEETKEKIREANIGEKNPAYGKGDRQLGDKNPMWGKESENRKPILQYTKEGVLVKEYDFISQVYEDGFSVGNVSNCARKLKGYKTHKGYIWKYKDKN